MVKKYHFIAIGGVGMSGLAKYLLQQGCTVSGSDISESKYTKLLKDMGATIFIGHSAEQVPSDAVVVVSSSIKETNVELVRAKELNLPVYHRSDLLSKISNSDKNFIGFSGTHGKTTTSGMCSYLLAKSGKNPSFVVGGILPEYNTNAEYSQNGNDFVAELDESDGTIVKYNPNVIVVNNLEADHLDFYKNGLKDIIYTFDNLFLSKLKGAKIILNKDDNGVKMLSSYSNAITYGLKDADYEARDIVYKHGSTNYKLFYKNEFLAHIELILPGVHNVYNSLAVISAIHQSGYEDIQTIVDNLKYFTGMGRRFQKVAEIDGVPIYDDYAHHPTEIKSTLSAMKTYTDKNVVAVFQPHRYTRLQSLWNEFKTALNSSLSDKDRLIVTDVYAASENEIDGINSELFASEIDNAEYISGSIKDVAEKLAPTLNNNCVVIGLGAGTITGLGNELAKLKEG